MLIYGGSQYDHGRLLGYSKGDAIYYSQYGSDYTVGYAKRGTVWRGTDYSDRLWIGTIKDGLVYRIRGAMPELDHLVGYTKNGLIYRGSQDNQRSMVGYVKADNEPSSDLDTVAGAALLLLILE